jgi:hypothetical protein
LIVTASRSVAQLSALSPAMAFFTASSWPNDFRDFDISVLAMA